MKINFLISLNKIYNVLEYMKNDKNAIDKRNNIEYNELVKPVKIPNDAIYVNTQGGRAIHKPKKLIS